MKIYEGNLVAEGARIGVVCARFNEFIVSMPRQAAIVYRAVGRAGVVLIAEGPAAKAAKLLASERRRTSRLVPNVPVHGFRVGAGKGPEVVDIADLPWPEPAAWIQAVGNHPLVASGPDGPDDRPLRAIGSRLYLQRYWADEQLIAHQTQARSRTLDVDPDALRAALARLFPDPGPDQQRLAIVPTQRLLLQQGQQTRDRRGLAGTRPPRDQGEASGAGGRHRQLLSVEAGAGW